MVLIERDQSVHTLTKCTHIYTRQATEQLLSTRVDSSLNSPVQTLTLTHSHTHVHLSNWFTATCYICSIEQHTQCTTHFESTCAVSARESQASSLSLFLSFPLPQQWQKFIILFVSRVVWIKVEKLITFPLAQLLTMATLLCKERRRKKGSSKQFGPLSCVCLCVSTSPTHILI